MCGEVCYGRFRRTSLHRTTVVVGTVAEEAVASLRTSGTLDLGDPEVCHNLVGQVDQAGQAGLGQAGRQIAPAASSVK